MGTVFKARHRTMGRIVAVKVIRKDRLTNARAVKRFEREIRAAAQLNHPHIVHAFDANEIDGTHFLVMEYVDNGVDLYRWVKKHGPLPVPGACEYIRQAALGLQQAHERGLVHRDIKPHNLLLQIADCQLPISQSAIGNRQSAIIKILDLGLARLSESETAGELSSTLTQEGTVMGTLDYMAPEQAADSHHVDIRADLYSLGCTFYFLLSGRVPFPGGDLMGKLLRHRTDEPKPIKEFRSDVPESVVAIICKLMAKRREDRYQTPAELVQALAGRTQMQATRPEPAGKATSPATSVADPFGDLWSDTATLAKPEKGKGRRDPLPMPLLWAGGGATLLLVIGVALLIAKGFRTSPTPTGDLQVQQTKAVSPTVETGVAELNRRLAADNALKPIAARVAALAAGNIETGEALRKELREFLIKHSATPAATEACDLLGQVLAKLPSPLDQLEPTKLPQDCIAHWRAAGGVSPPVELVAVLGEHRQRQWEPVMRVAYDPDSKLIASAGGAIYLWNAETLQLQAILRQQKVVYNVAFSPDGRELLSSGDGLHLWRVATRQHIRRFGDDDQGVFSASFSADGRRALSAEGRKLIRLWDLETGKELRRLEGHAEQVNRAIFLPDGRRALSCSHDKTARLWDLHTAKELGRFQGHTSFVYSVAVSADGRTAISGGHDGVLRVWDVETMKQVRAIEGHKGAICSVAFLADGRAMSSSEDNTMRVWDLANGKELRRFEGHRGYVLGFALSPDGRTVVSGSVDTTVRLWGLATGKELRPLTGDTGAVYRLAIAPDNSFLVCGGRDGSVRLWRLPQLEPISLRRGEKTNSDLTAVAVSPDGKKVAASSQDTFTRLWSLENGKPAAAVTELRHQAYVPVVAFSPDGRTLAHSASDKGPIALWDVSGPAPKEPHLLEGHTGRVESLAFSLDGSLLASGAAEADGRTGGRLRLWDLTAQPVCERPGWMVKGVGGQKSVAFTPEGAGLVSGGEEDAVRLWNIANGQEVAKFEPGWVTTSVSISPDGKLIAAANETQGVTVWSRVTRRKVFTFQPPGLVSAVAFAPDNRHLATANGNGTVYIFRIFPVAHAPGSPPKALSAEEAKVQQEEEAKRLGVRVEISNSIGMKLRLIPPGRFLMGSPEDEPFRTKNESPVHEVQLSRPFFMGIHEVTLGQFQSFVKASGYQTEAEKDGKGALRLNAVNAALEMDPRCTWRNPGWQQSDDHPAVCLSWNDALSFCRWLSKQEGKRYRLPTEAEWEYACRAGTRTVYFFGDEPAKLSDFAWHKGNSRRQAQPVGRFKPNAFGLFDTHGNAAEFCADFYEEDYYQHCPIADPQGPATGMERIGRGGSWNGVRLRAAMRGKNDLGYRCNNHGFRVVCECRPP